MGTPQNGSPLKIVVPMEDPPQLPAPAPADRVPGYKQPLLLVAQVVWILLILLPSVLWSLVRKIFPPKRKSLKDKVVLVTGAGRGLGKGLALGFAKEGAKVAVVDVFSSPALETAKEIAEAGGVGKAYTANVAKVEDIRRLRQLVTEDLGPVDVLVNNAGLIYGNSLVGMSEADLRAVVEVNFLSHFLMTQEFLPSMLERNSGHIVAIGSLSALAGVGNGVAYSACKSGVMGYMDSLREELNLNPDNNIKTTTVFPYFINTSAYYLDQWDLRIPPISIEEAVDATIAGVRRDLVSFSVPDHLYFNLHMMQMYPQNVTDYCRKVFYARVLLPSIEKRALEPAQHIIAKMTAK